MPTIPTDAEFYKKFGEMHANSKAAADGVKSLSDEFNTWRIEHERDDSKVHGDHGARLNALEKKSDRADDKFDQTGQHTVHQLESKIIDSRTARRWMIGTFIALALGMFSAGMAIAQYMKH